MLESFRQEGRESLETGRDKAGRDDQHRGESSSQVLRGPGTTEGEETTQSRVHSTSQGRPQVHEVRGEGVGEHAGDVGEGGVGGVRNMTKMKLAEKPTVFYTPT